MNIIDRDLRKAGNDTDNLEKKKAMISDMFADNRKRLAEAETEAENAEKLANEVNKVWWYFISLCFQSLALRLQ